ncbi:MAG TPA: type II toxin-antitoxin system ParD family antitoxin [Candidatus Peribacterales bacterium]|nr:type II toxin-antitoxin system ParD family antitoxin [Candidatus Peribacterales bacterium]
MASINISLPEALLKFLKEQVKQHGYSTVSEYIRALLRENQKGKAMQEKLDALLLEGLESGPPTPMTVKDWECIHEEVEMRIKHRKQK